RLLWEHNVNWQLKMLGASHQNLDCKRCMVLMSAAVVHHIQIFIPEAGILGYSAGCGRQPYPLPTRPAKSKNTVG
ncbi:hypothetical protein E2562_006897, partial [Oryza meyeriana var. granulata]